MPHHKLFSLLGEEDKVPRREQQGVIWGGLGAARFPWEGRADSRLEDTYVGVKSGWVSVCRGLELEGGCVFGNGESGWTSTRGEGQYQKRAGGRWRPEGAEDWARSSEQAETA